VRRLLMLLSYQSSTRMGLVLFCAICWYAVWYWSILRVIWWM
jgi:hypothetical protein